MKKCLWKRLLHAGCLSCAVWDGFLKFLCHTVTLALVILLNLPPHISLSEPRETQREKMTLRPATSRELCVLLEGFWPQPLTSVLSQYLLSTWSQARSSRLAAACGGSVGASLLQWEDSVTSDLVPGLTVGFGIKALQTYRWSRACLDGVNRLDPFHICLNMNTCLYHKHQTLCIYHFPGIDMNFCFSFSM